MHIIYRILILPRHNLTEHVQVLLEFSMENKGGLERLGSGIIAGTPSFSSRNWTFLPLAKVPNLFHISGMS